MNDQVLAFGSILVVLALIPAYGVLWEIHMVPWNRGPYKRMGRVLFSKSAVIALTLTLSFIGGTLALEGLGRPLWFEIFRLCVFSLIVPILWWQWLVYRRIRLSSTVDPEDDPETDLTVHH